MIAGGVAVLAFTQLLLQRIEFSLLKVHNKLEKVQTETNTILLNLKESIITKDEGSIRYVNLKAEQVLNKSLENQRDYESLISKFRLDQSSVTTLVEKEKASETILNVKTYRMFKQGESHEE